MTMEKTEGKSGWNDRAFDAGNGVHLLYQLWLPEGYTPEKKYSFILYMHSAGVRCDDNSAIYTPEAKFLRNFEKSRYAAETVILAPCCPRTDKWVPADRWDNTACDFLNTEPTRYMSAVLELFSCCRGRLSLDETRFYTYGMSMGGFAVWDLLTRNPGVFAAAVPVAGGGDPRAVDRMKGTAIWCFHGTADPVVPVACCRTMAEALRASGRTDVKVTEFEGAGHGIWVATADTEGLLDWLFSQKREG